MHGQMLVFKPKPSPSRLSGLVQNQKPDVVRKLTAEPPLEDIKAQLDGGYLEAVAGFTSITIDGQQWACVAFCDEEGKLKGLEHNSRATFLWDRALRALKHPGLVTSDGRVLDRLVGPVVVLAGDDEFIRSLSAAE